MATRLVPCILSGIELILIFSLAPVPSLSLCKQSLYDLPPELLGAELVVKTPTGYGALFAKLEVGCTPGLDHELAVLDVDIAFIVNNLKTVYLIQHKAHFTVFGVDEDVFTTVRIIQDDFGTAFRGKHFKVVILVINEGRFYAGSVETAYHIGFGRIVVYEGADYLVSHFRQNS